MRNTSQKTLPEPGLLRSVSTALAVLEAFTAERPALGVTELSGVRRD